MVAGAAPERRLRRQRLDHPACARKCARGVVSSARAETVAERARTSTASRSGKTRMSSALNCHARAAISFRTSDPSQDAIILLSFAWDDLRATVAGGGRLSAFEMLSTPGSCTFGAKPPLADLEPLRQNVRITPDGQTSGARHRRGAEALKRGAGIDWGMAPRGDRVGAPVG